MAKKSNSEKYGVWKFYKVEGDRLESTRQTCPKCGSGVFLAKHKNRVSCGKCGYTQFESKAKQ